MNTNRVMRWSFAVLGTATVLSTAACSGQKDVTFQPQAATGSATTAPSAGGTGGTASGGSGQQAAVPSDVSVSTQGSTVCVSRKGQSGQACVSAHGTAMVNGVTVVDGKVVGVQPQSGDSVVANGGNPVSTSGPITLSGASTWSGTAHGECYGGGTSSRHATVQLDGGGTLTVTAVGNGVANVELRTSNGVYTGNWLGDSGVITLSDKSLTFNDARFGRADAVVRLSGSLDC